jgi:hypothetical protein
MLTQASVESLRTYFDTSELDGTETIYAARNGNNVAFVAIASSGSIKTFKNDGYPEELLEQEIMLLCCSQYDDKLTHMPIDTGAEGFSRESEGTLRSIAIEILVAFIVLILGAFFLLIHWVLFKDFQAMLIIGGAISLLVVFYIFPKLTAKMNL